MISDYGEYVVREISMPSKIRGFVVLDEDGFPNIYINSKLSFIQKRKTLKHELVHIDREDFTNSLPIEVVEGLA